jgi:hypothetical protein
MVHGVGRDADHIARHIAARTARRPAGADSDAGVALSRAG